MFRSTNFDKLLDKATSNLLMEPDWNANLQICDLIRQQDIQPKYALTAIKKKLCTTTNQHSALYALQVLETVVKNCGTGVHEELTARAYCEQLHDLAKTTPFEPVRQKLLELIQAWSVAFRKNPKYGALKDTMAAMKAEGYKFPASRESDAMFIADTAPEWTDGDVCHRCRVAFTLIQRKHHCRACGQVFCGQCSQKTTTLPKFGIEKDVRVCDACYDQVNRPSSSKGLELKDELPPEYLSSSLAQQSQCPPVRTTKTEEELREEEELNLALAISQSEAEAKEKANKTKVSYFGAVKSNTEVKQQQQQQQEPENPELARYLNRSYWETLQQQQQQQSPSAPSQRENKLKKDSVEEFNGNRDESDFDNNSELEEFTKTLNTQLEIFINRMKSNSSRGRSITNDTSVQTLFLNLTAMHSRLLRYIHQFDDKRLYYERLQDKRTQFKDARAALDDLRQEHQEKMRREAEEQERQRQLQMAHKLEIMRKKKQEYLQYQRQLALQRIQEQEREMQMRQEQQKQQYLRSGGSAFAAQVPQQVIPPVQQFQAPPPTFNYPYMGGQYQMGPTMPPPPMQFQQPPLAPPPPTPPQQQNTAPKKQDSDAELISFD